MRLWKKICLSSLIFFLIIYFCSCIMIIEKNVKDNFNRTMQRAADEQASISSGMIRYADTNKMKDYGDDHLYQEYIKEYLESRVNSQGIFLEVQEGDTVLYSNFDEGLPTKDLDVNNYFAVTQYRVLESGEKRYLCLTHQVLAGDREFRNTYLTDITDIYLNRKEQYIFFAKMSLGVSVILIIGMYVISNHLLKSIHVLNDSIRKIEQGDYKDRVQINSTDEVGELAESYNHMAEAVDNRIQQLRIKTEEQQRFINNFTHELRTPLTAVVGYADLIRSTSGDEEEYQEMGERIFREGKRIEKLSELMMDLVFLKNSEFKMKSEDICDILQEAELTLTPVLIQQKMQLNLDLPEQPLIVLAERGLILNLIYNLVDNGKKASKAGDTIQIKAEAVNHTVVVEVIDHGIGIPEHEQEKVFETFYKVDKVRNRKNSGVGMGLSICSDIVRLHKANLELTSQTGKGTNIKIIFPCYISDTKED